MEQSIQWGVSLRGHDGRPGSIPRAVPRSAARVVRVPKRQTKNRAYESCRLRHPQNRLQIFEFPKEIGQIEAVPNWPDFTGARVSRATTKHRAGHSVAFGTGSEGHEAVALVSGQSSPVVGCERWRRTASGRLALLLLASDLHSGQHPQVVSQDAPGDRVAFVFESFAA